jgi:hypothetical protein
MRTRTLSLIVISLITTFSFGAEFALINQEITLTSSNNGFYFFMSPSKGPVDWYTPDNYYNGQIYFRYEVLSQPTNEVCYFSFDIWGDYNGSTYTESAAPISGPLNGSGSVTIFNSSPSTWYQHPVTGPVNFHNRNSFWRWGICHWFSKSPNYLLAPIHWSDDPESWEAWSHNSTWLPVTIRVTVVAVSQGSAFSGWENYLSPTRKPTPTYGIDYAAIQTNKVVPSTDEYSFNSDMSGAVNGNGQKLALTPGQDVYFRTKAGDGLDASYIQHLDVPSRPTTPSISIDYINELTVENVPSNIEYSSTSGFQNPSSGTGSKLAITPGQDLYFRVKSTASAFASSAFFLNVPDRQATPSITIDFINEVTSEVLVNVEYSSNPSMSSAVSGTNNPLPLTPESDLYFRSKATSGSFKSEIQILDVPDRPQIPSIEIDYVNETTSPVSSSIEYSVSESMTGSQSGINSPIALTPGTDVYFRFKATSAQFRSNIQHLNVPPRPSQPTITFDYFTEESSVINETQEYSLNGNMVPASAGLNQTISVVPGTNLFIRIMATNSSFASTIQELSIPDRPSIPAFEIDFPKEQTSTVIPDIYEYSGNPDFTEVISGTNDYVSIIPGMSIYFRQKATNTQFKSLNQELSVPARPEYQVYTIDFVNETTAEPVHNHDEYSFYEDMTDALEGEDAPLILTPDTSYYLRVKATSSSFASESFRLIIPARPSITSTAGDTVAGNFSVSVEYEDTTGLDEEDFDVINAHVNIEETGIIMEPVATGMILIRLKANAFDIGNFASLSLRTYAQLPTVVQESSCENSLIIYPNPLGNELHLKLAFNTTSFPVTFQIIDIQGFVVNQVVTGSELTVMDTENLPSGIYFVKVVDSQGNTAFNKIVKQ